MLTVDVNFNTVSQDDTETRPRVIVGIAGSLRRGSYNRALLEAARGLAPKNLSIEIFDLRDVPLYDGDVEAAGDPPAVRELKQRIARADGILIATPEYNGAIPGVLKNAIDWASRPPERALRGKSIAIVGATPGRGNTSRAQLSARQVLTNVGAQILDNPGVAITGAGDRFDANVKLIDDETRVNLRALLEALAAFVAVES